MKKFTNATDAAMAIERPGMCKCIMETTPKLTVKGRKSKLPLPEKFVGLKKITYGTFPIGYEYYTEEKGVGRSITASGGDPKDFTVQKASGMSPDPECKNHTVYQKDDNPAQKYIRLYKQNGLLHSKSQHVYINGAGEIVVPTKDEYAEYFKELPANPPDKQKNAGVADDKAVLPISPKAENIKYLQKGDVVFGDENKAMEKVLKLLHDLTV